jgi:uncharacterized membrane protein
MKQEHFMQILRNELRNLPKHEVDEIIADYREYISDAIAAGRREEEVIAALGDPLKLAREMKAQANYRQWENDRTLSNLLRVVISVAGLGVMNFLLFFPFLFYMLMLSVGYIMSTVFVISGVVLVIGAAGHKLFDWPPLPTRYLENNNGDIVLGSHRHERHSSRSLVVSIPASSTSPAPLVPPQAPLAQDQDADNADSAGSGVAGDRHAVAVKGGRFVISLDASKKVELVMKSGAAAEIKSKDGKVDIESTAPDIDQSVHRESKSVISVARADVQVLEVKGDDGDSFEYVAGEQSGETHWRAHSGNDDVSLDQSASTGNHIAVHDGKNSVDIDSGHVLIHDEDGNDISIGGFSGLSLIGTVLLLGIGLMCVGVLGLWLCVWVSRLTWRGLARYVKYQISVVTGKETLLTTE